MSIDTPDLQALIELLPKCITDPDLCSQYEFVGSRITCDPPVLDTDLDVLCMLVDSRFAEVMWSLQTSGWTFDGSEYYANALDNNVGFRSYRNGELNLVLTTDPQFYRLFSAASSVAKRLNLLDKSDRIALFQAVIYGNAAEARQTAPTLPGAGGGDALDARRWRHARRLFTIDDIEGAQGAHDSFGGLVSEEECVRADAAIDAALPPQQGG